MRHTISVVCSGCGVIRKFKASSWIDGARRRIYYCTECGVEKHLLESSAGKVVASVKAFLRWVWWHCNYFRL